MATYLITGGAGFIGSHLAERLLKDNHEVIIIDNLSTGKRENLPSNIKFYQEDICHQSLVRTLMRKADACFHLAAVASVQKCQDQWLTSHQTNLTGTISILNAAKENHTPVIYASSSAVYGDNTQLPLNELADKIPLSAYAADKLACELHANVASQAFNVPTIGLRFFNVYGTRQDPNSPYSGVIPIFLKNITNNQPITIFGDGQQSRDFIFIDDVIDGLLAAAKHCNCQSHVLNLCTGKQSTLIELYQMLEKITQNKIECRFKPARQGDILHSCGNTKKAKQILNFEAKVSLYHGLKQLYNLHQF